MKKLQLYIKLLFAYPLIFLLFSSFFNSPAYPNESLKILNPKAQQLLQWKIQPLVNRISSLKGKTLYIINNKWGGADAQKGLLDAIKNRLEKDIQDINIVYIEKKGPYFYSDKKLWGRIASNADAVIIGVGHCSTATPAIIRQAIEIEKLGVPAIPIINPFFIQEAKITAHEKGWPSPRIVSPEEPNALRNKTIIKQLLNGKDAWSSKPFMTAIIDALTKPLQEHEKMKGKLTHPAEPRFLPVNGTEDELQQYFLANKMTDGLPIILPTENRVSKMLRGTSLKPNKIVNKKFTLGVGKNGQLEGRNITVEKVAIVSVMAGANPKYFPVILALASYGSPFNSSAQSFTGMAVVHGPIANQIGMNSEFGALGPYNHANATIGRAWQLMARNFAFADPGTTLLGTWGNNHQYNCLTFAENLSEQLPSGWQSFHMEKGFKKTKNIISIWSGRGFRQRVGHDIPYLTLKTLENVTFGGGLVLLPSISAKILSEDYGIKNKKEFRKFLYSNSYATIKEWRATDLVQTFHIPGVEIGWSPKIVNKYMKLNDENLIKRFYSPSQINIMIVGSGPIFFTQGGDFELKKMVDIDEWD